MTKEICPYCEEEPSMNKEEARCKKCKLAILIQNKIETKQWIKERDEILKKFGKTYKEQLRAKNSQQQ